MKQPLLLALRLILIVSRVTQYIVDGGSRFKRELCADRYSFNRRGDLSYADRLSDISPEVAALINFSTKNFRLRHRLVLCSWSLW